MWEPSLSWQSKEQKEDLKAIFDGRTKKWKSLDYVAGWLMKAADYGTQTNTVSAFVSTNSICQGQQVPILWPLIFESGREIGFAHTSFKWNNLASNNAGVTTVIVGLREIGSNNYLLFSENTDSDSLSRVVSGITPYLTSGKSIIIEKASSPISSQTKMVNGNKPTDGGNLIMSSEVAGVLVAHHGVAEKYIKDFYGSSEFISNSPRKVLWIGDIDISAAQQNTKISEILSNVEKSRQASTKVQTRELSAYPHRFEFNAHATKNHVLVVPRVSSENRPFLPIGVLDRNAIIGDRNFALYDAPLWNMALIASRLHWVWIGTVCVRMRTDFSYSNTLGWNTFPVPDLRDEDKAALTKCAEDILLARSAHFPKTIADLYKPDDMPDDLRAAHDRNDETLERIYIGRRFKTDTERLETLFDLYTKMTSKPQKKAKRA